MQQHTHTAGQPQVPRANACGWRPPSHRLAHPLGVCEVLVAAEGAKAAQNEEGGRFEVHNCVCWPACRWAPHCRAQVGSALSTLGLAGTLASMANHLLPRPPLMPRTCGQAVHLALRPAACTPSPVVIIACQAEGPPVITQLASAQLACSTGTRAPAVTGHRVGTPLKQT